MTPVRLEPAAPWSRVKHSITEPLRSHNNDDEDNGGGDNDKDGNDDTGGDGGGI